MPPRQIKCHEVEQRSYFTRPDTATMSQTQRMAAFFAHRQAMKKIHDALIEDLQKHNGAITARH